MGTVWRFFNVLTGYYQVFSSLGTAQSLTGLLYDLTLALLFKDTFFLACLKVVTLQPKPYTYCWLRSATLSATSGAPAPAAPTDWSGSPEEVL